VIFIFLLIIWLNFQRALSWATAANLEAELLQEVNHFANYSRRCDSEEELSRMIKGLINNPLPKTEDE
jgi:hypothetical protein